MPPGVTSIQIDLYGGQGGGAQNASGLFPTGADGGKGAHVQSIRTVNPGEALTIQVGGQGLAPGTVTPGSVFFGGGGGGLAGSLAPVLLGGTSGGGGGGASTLDSVSTGFLVAGGGGGSGAQAFSGGGASGASGAAQAGGGGGAGTSSGGGAGGSGSSAAGPCDVGTDPGLAGAAGSALAGGAGGGGGAYGGGGGGGGFFGGGGGGAGWLCSNSGPSGISAGAAGGGGGGSNSLAAGSGFTEGGSRSGDGEVTITYTTAGTGGPWLDCADVKASNPGWLDGNYEIQPSGGEAFTVYCSDMAGTPKEYLTLAETGPGKNFSSYVAGGESSGTDVVTSFTKVRLDPATLEILIEDRTFSNSVGGISHPDGGGPVSVTSMPYGAAMNCNASPPFGTANVDLRGTPFKVTEAFVLTGASPVGGACLRARPIRSSISPPRASAATSRPTQSAASSSGSRVPRRGNRVRTRSASRTRPSVRRNRARTSSSTSPTTTTTRSAPTRTARCARRSSPPTRRRTVARPTGFSSTEASPR